MNRSEIEQQTDEIIGEAVLFLLREKMPINTRALITHLRKMKSNEPDDSRRALIAQVIAEVSNTQASVRRKSLRDQHEPERDTGNNRSNVYPLFDDRQQSGATKKH